MKKKKKDMTTAIVIAVAITYLGYLAAGCTDEQGVLTFQSVLSGLPEVLNRPFGNYWNNQYSIQGILIGLVLGVYIALYFYFTRKNWMWGKEQGSAEWADPKAITKKLTHPADKKKGAEDNYYRCYSQNLQISMDMDWTHLNNNVLIVAGSRKGKTLTIVGPNVMLCCGSMIITDPKKEVLRTYGNFLKSHGYEIQVLDLIDFERSDQYNPFVHIKGAEDIPELVELIWNSLEDPKAQKDAPIWDQSAKSLIEGLCYYIFLEKNEEARTFRTLMRMLTDLSLDDKYIDKMRREMTLLRRKNLDHPAAIKYLSAMSGASDTVKSVLFSATGRLSAFYDDKLLRIMDGNQIDFEAIGMGYKEDRTKKTALFFCIPDADTRWNFVVSLAYMQAFKELYYAADHYCTQDRGRLPIPITCWLDEFANVPLPNTFPKLVSTMAGRNISCVIVLQDPSQLEDLYKDQHKTIRNNCDVTIYLGGSEYETHKWISERLGQATIDKRSTSKSYGIHGNDSRSDDVLGRELMKPNEVGKLFASDLIIFVAGFDPVMDKKYRTLTSRNFYKAKLLGNYFHQPERPDASEGQEKKNPGKERKKAKEKEALFEELTKEDLEFYRQAAEAGEPITIHTFNLDSQQPLFIEKVMQDRLAQMERFKGYQADQLEIIRQALLKGCSADKIQQIVKPGMKASQIKAVLSGFLGISF